MNEIYALYKNEWPASYAYYQYHHSACYTVEMGASAGDLTRITLDNNHTGYRQICLQGAVCVSKITRPK